jgi:secondary thiamine-phosphate synthase enzyme
MSGSMWHQEEILLATGGHRDMQDVTGEVAAIVTRSGVQTGLVHVFNVGSTGALATIEFEPGLQQDLPELLDRLIPPSREYGHELAWHDGNGHSHLQATLLGPSLTAPIRDGQLALGTWQQIVHLECDVKPRERRLVVTVHGER